MVKEKAEVLIIGGQTQIDRRTTMQELQNTLKIK
jgi:hypothetical protein